MATVFEAFQKAAESLFAQVREPRSLTLVVDWEIGQNDYPAGMIVTRDKNVQPDDLLRVVGQLHKMSDKSIQLYALGVARLSEELAAKDEEIKKLKALAVTDTKV